MANEAALSTKVVDGGAVLHVKAASAGYAEGTAAKAREWLDRGIPLDATRRQAAALMAFKAAHFGDLKRYVHELAEREELSGMLGSP